MSEFYGTGRGDGKRPCSPACIDDEVLIATSYCESGGAKGLCCQSTINTLEHCQAGDCINASDVEDACPSDYPALLTYTAGSPDKYCKHGKVRPMCCEDDPAPPIKNCQWVGTPPLCKSLPLSFASTFLSRGTDRAAQQAGTTSAKMAKSLSSRIRRATATLLARAGRHVRIVVTPQGIRTRPFRGMTCSKSIRTSVSTETQ